jgi:hypothetical protein
MSGYVISKISGLFDGINGAFKGFLLPNGKEFLNAYPYILAQSGVPVGIAPNGTVATNGAITLVTALPRIYSSGIWVYLPAGSVSGGAAGLYWCVMSSVTVGQVYTNFADTSQGFVPYIPTGTLVNAVGSNAAYTQITNTDIVIIAVTVPANSLGLSGRYRDQVFYEFPNNANGKIYKAQFGGYQFKVNNTTGVTSASIVGGFANKGVAGSQSSQTPPYSTNGLGTSTTFGADLSADTTINNFVTYTANLAVASDYIIIEYLLSEVLPS